MPGNPLTFLRQRRLPFIAHLKNSSWQNSSGIWNVWYSGCSLLPCTVRQYAAIKPSCHQSNYHAGWQAEKCWYSGILYMVLFLTRCGFSNGWSLSITKSKSISTAIIPELVSFKQILSKRTCKCAKPRLCNSSSAFFTSSTRGKRQC